MPKPTHILVIRLSAMGDVAMTVPVLRLVVQTYSDVKITLVSRRTFEPLFTDIPNVRFLEADVYGKHKGLGLLKLAKEARLLGIDAVADLHNVIRSKNMTRILRLRGISSITIDKGRAEKRKLVNAKGMGLIKLKSTHQRYADVFERLGLPIDLSTPNFPDRKPLNARLHTLIGTAPKKWIGIAPFAAYKGKMYPMEMMKEVLAHLEDTQLYRVLLFGGGKEEMEQLKELETQFSTVTNVGGALTFSEELDLISNLDLMISMDSANGHLAAIYGIPVITLWGVTHPYAGFTPYQQPDENQLKSDRNQYPLIPTSVYGNKYPSDYEDVMQTIETKTILDKIQDLL
ncbi:MAG: ADP-heptose--LPS heptosyltransferase RfaF [Bacteroidetes bacterium]|nr:MAG: ADP-heptose--LPS heptosyltransferase RfaF [Bacteroidota bacterium]